jgi:lysophospholipase L1-like esterase
MVASRSRRAAAIGVVLGLCAVAAVAPQSPTVYIAFGDSITLGTGDEQMRGGYPARLQSLLAGAGQNVTVRNRGLGGETTIEGLARIDSVLAEGGNALLLMEGTNDIARNVSVETTIFNLDEMARRAQSRGMSTLHATLIPRIPGANVDPDNSLTQRRVENIRDLGGTSGRMLADPFEVFITTPDVFARYYSHDPEDHVGHPNSAGYDLLAGVFFDRLTGKDNVPPVTGITTPATGRTGVRPDVTIRMDVWDFGTGIDILSTQLLIDGQVVPATLVAGNQRVHLDYRPPKPLTGLVEVGLRARDRAEPPNRVDRVVNHFTTSRDELDGDVDGSERVDGVDLLLLARAFGATAAETRYLADADFNEDEVVDGDDLAVLAANFGKSR